MVEAGTPRYCVCYSLRRVADERCVFFGGGGETSMGYQSTPEACPPPSTQVWPTTPEARPPPFRGGSDDVSCVTVAVGYMYMYMYM